MSTTMGINKDSKPKRTRSCFRIPDELKLEIVRDYLLNGINQYQIAKNYGIGQQSVSRIIRNFASSNDKSALLMKNRPTDSQADEIKALREEVMELKKKLHSETMRADFYDTMIDVAEEMFNIEIRKKAGTGQSKGCTKTK
jgi:transposase-like protein